jgi:broad specificity phosphatase PhoE
MSTTNNNNNNNNNTDDNKDRRKTTVSEGNVRPSISLRLIRHAESRNNEVYRNARYIYRGGTPEFDEDGWNSYVDTHRSSDPGLSATGQQQADSLAKYLVPHLANQASQPVQVICSPMRRTMATIKPTLDGLHKAREEANANASDSANANATTVMVHGFYFESEGCHTHDKPEEGMNPAQITEFLQENTASLPAANVVRFEGFPDPNKGWYCNGKGAETRAESEIRASKFYLWLCEHLDQQLQNGDAMDGVFDAGVAVPGEEREDEHDKHAPRQRRRRTALLLGHGDFMSLVLKRIVAGFGHAVENEGIPHRSAFAHFNTGMTELEYFGKGRFLIMGHNQTPHFSPDQHAALRSGGSLKDGWSYLMPNDEFILDVEVSVAFSDELEGHVREQAEALKALYLSSNETEKLSADSSLSVEKATAQDASAQDTGGKKKQFIVKHGLQVVGVATYSEDTGTLTDVAVRPSAGKAVSETLFDAVKQHSKKMGRSGSLLVMPRSTASKKMFEALGFAETDEDNMAFIH